MPENNGGLEMNWLTEDLQGFTDVQDPGDGGWPCAAKMERWGRCEATCQSLYSVSLIKDQGSRYVLRNSADFGGGYCSPSKEKKFQGPSHNKIPLQRKKISNFETSPQNITPPTKSQKPKTRSQLVRLGEHRRWPIYVVQNMLHFPIFRPARRVSSLNPVDMSISQEANHQSAGASIDATPSVGIHP